MLIYGFFQHTEFIKKLGWLEFFLNTPSHHRVHHASDEKYLDKNFGLVLIIWDKFFGTFEPEETKPAYGLTKPLKTFNPFKIIFSETIIMIKDVLAASSWRERIFYIFKKPGWSDLRRQNITSVKPLIAKKNVCKKCAKCSSACIARMKKVTDSINFLPRQVSLKQG
jgi:hypothetical protein